jgi:hypothetical protein
MKDEQTIGETIEGLEGATASERTDERAVVHAWRIEQLERLGISRVVAEGFAGRVDWHAIAALVNCGCAPDLALDIVR